MLIIKILLLVILTELITELIIKSEIFKPIRTFIQMRNPWLEKLFSCGYCFSVWAALGVVFVTQISYPLTGSNWLDLGFTALAVHRLSNILHNVIDKWTDKYYSLGHVNTDKSKE